MVSVLRSSLLAALVLTLSGCPGADPQPAPSAPATSPPSPGRQAVSPEVRPRESLAPPSGGAVAPRPAPQDAAAAWRDAAARAQGWPLRLAKALKGDAERAALTAPFASPSPELRRLLDLIRSWPHYDAKVRRAVSFQRRLRLLYEEEQALDPGALPPAGDAALGLLLLADPSVWWSERWLLTKEGWQSPKRGLSDGTLSEEHAQALVAGLQAARDGKWTLAAPKLLPVFSALAEESSALAGAEREWRAVREARDPQAHTAALAAWSARFVAKSKSAPSRLSQVKK